MLKYSKLSLQFSRTSAANVIVKLSVLGTVRWGPRPLWCLVYSAHYLPRKKTLPLAFLFSPRQLVRRSPPLRRYYRNRPIRPSGPRSSRWSTRTTSLRSGECVVPVVGSARVAPPKSFFSPVHSRPICRTPTSPPRSCDDLASENLHLIWDILPSAIPDLDLLKKNPGVRETPKEFGEYDLGVSKT